jgi:competence ComEA-like helix-hairpin-helix protein
MQMFRMVLSIAAAAFLLAAHTPAVSAAQSKAAARTAAAKPTAGKPLNINTASVAELDALPGIGAKTAALIVEYRQKNGLFKKIEDLREVGATFVTLRRLNAYRRPAGCWGRFPQWLILFC